MAAFVSLSICEWSNYVEVSGEAGGEESLTAIYNLGFLNFIVFLK